MKKFRIYFLFALFIGCLNSSYREEEESLKKILFFYKKGDVIDRKIHIITGLDGCGACLNYTVKIVKENINNEQMFFIISGNSKKQLKYKFDEEIIKNSNFILDTNLFAMKLNLIGQEKPEIYFCQNGNIVDIKSLTYSNVDSVSNYMYEFLNR